LPVALIVGLILLACGGLAFALYRFAAARRPASDAPFASLQSMKLMRLPASGMTTYASISPDGKYLVRVAYEAGNQSIRLRQVATASEREIVPPTDDYFLGATFSPDGTFIYYPRGKRGQGWRELYRVSVLGSDPQKLIFDIDSPVTISPDGKRLAFKRHVPKNNEDNLLTANEDGSGEQPLVVRKLPVSIGTSAWSPDGRSIAYVVSGRDPEGYYVDIEEVNVSDKSTRKILSGRWREIRSIAWLSDSSGLVITARDRASLPSAPVQIWHVSYPEGQAQKVTNDVNAYVGVSLTSDARSILALQANDTSQIWLAPGTDSARARQITSNGINGAPVWTPDNRIVYFSNASGNGDIWMMNADGSGAKQLTFDQNNDTMPSVSADGRHIVFISNRSVGWGIWKMSADGSNARELVRNVDRDSHPHWSPDSQWVFYNSRDDAGRLAYWKVSSEGGEPLKIADENISYSRLSPDGKLFLTLYRDPEPESPLKIHLIPAEGGQPVRVLDAPQAIDQINWSHDGQAIEFVITQEGVSNIWRMPLNGGGKPKQLTDWKTDFINWYSWSRDGKQLAAARGTSTTEMVLIKDFR
jgi:Tol biopolymer transport system component